MNRSRFLTTAARELAKYKLDLVGEQEIRGDKGGTKIFKKKKKITNWEQDFLYIKEQCQQLRE
jgi:hypothetical protein